MKDILKKLTVLCCVASLAAGCGWIRATGDSVEAVGDGAGHAIEETGDAFGRAASQTEDEIEEGL